MNWSRSDTPRLHDNMWLPKVQVLVPSRKLQLHHYIKSGMSDTLCDQTWKGPVRLGETRVSIHVLLSFIQIIGTCKSFPFRTGSYSYVSLKNLGCLWGGRLWTLDPGWEDWGPKDPESWGLCCTVTVKIQLYRPIYTCILRAKLTAMSCTSSLCTPKALFIADNTISNYPLTCLILRVVYCQFRKVRLAHTKQERLRDYCIWPLTLGPQCELACNKGDYSWVCRVKEKES